MYKRKIQALLLVVLSLSIVSSSAMAQVVDSMMQFESSAQLYQQREQSDDNTDWQTPILEDEIPYGDSATMEFLSQEWRGPLSQDEIRDVELSSAAALSNADSILTEERAFPDSSVDRNGTFDDEDPLDFGIESESERGWPWQPWPSQRKDFAATVLSPPREGHWFPRKSYSVLAFDITFEYEVSSSDDVYIWTWIVNDQDLYSRYLTFWWDNQMVHQRIITPWDLKTSIKIEYDDFKDYLGVGHHRLEIAINYGAWKDHGWKMIYVWPGIGPTPWADDQHPPLRSHAGAPPWPGEGRDAPTDFFEFTPNTGSSNVIVEYQVYAGTSTYLNLVTDNWDDTSTRPLRVYWDGSFKAYLYSPGSFQIWIGNENDDSIHTLKLKFSNMPIMHYAKRITTMAVHHRGWNVELDCMYGLDYGSLVNGITYTQAYYKVHSYHRMDLSLDETDIVYDDYTTDSEYRSLHNSHFDHSGQAGWTWALLANKLEGEPIAFYMPGYGLAFAQETIDDGRETEGGTRTQWMTMSFMHEFGHSIGIKEGPGEVYCWNTDCVMASASAENTHYHDAWYCFYHFWLRNKH